MLTASSWRPLGTGDAAMTNTVRYTAMSPEPFKDRAR